MFLELIELIRNNILPLNFLCHLCIFFGGFYVALHSRLLPFWAITGLWYVGLASVTNCFAILFQWFYGIDCTLSYANIGFLTETLLNIVIAVNIALFFSDTIIKDFKGMKERTKT